MFFSLLSLISLVTDSAGMQRDTISSGLFWCKICSKQIWTLWGSKMRETCFDWLHPGLVHGWGTHQDMYRSIVLSSRIKSPGCVLDPGINGPGYVLDPGIKTPGYVLTPRINGPGYVLGSLNQETRVQRRNGLMITESNSSRIQEDCFAHKGNKKRTVYWSSKLANCKEGGVWALLDDNGILRLKEGNRLSFAQMGVSLRSVLCSFCLLLFLYHWHCWQVNNEVLITWGGVVMTVSMEGRPSCLTRGDISIIGSI